MIIPRFETHIQEIALLNPLEESAFEYKVDRWKALDDHHKKLICDFEGKIVTRQDVIEAYGTCYSGYGDCIQAFLLTMVWGFADTGYGPYRTMSYISTKENIDLIREAIDSVGRNDLKGAYYRLKKIKGLGISYISKVLYFASRGAGHAEYALIFDIRVARALVRLTTPPEVFQIVEVYPSSSFTNYERYNKLIHGVAYQYKLEAESIEHFLFNQM